MTNRAHAHGGDLTRPHDLTPADQVMYLSLSGLQAWDMYRQGMNRGMLLDMFAHSDPLSVFIPGVAAMLKACVGSDRFPHRDDLATFIWQQMQQLREHDLFYLFEQQVHTSVHDHDFAEFYAAYPVHDVRTVWVDKVVTYMLDELYVSRGDADGVYCNIMTATWVAMCDATLARHRQAVRA